MEKERNDSRTGINICNKNSLPHPEAEKVRFMDAQETSLGTHGVAEDGKCPVCTRTSTAAPAKPQPRMGMAMPQNLRGNMGVSSREDCAILTQCIADGDSTHVQALLSTSINVNAVDDDGLSALAYAAARRHRDVVKLLLDAKAVPRIKCTDMNMLMKYVFHRNTDLVKGLLQLKSQIQKMQGIKWLHSAVTDGRVAVVKLLLAAGAPIDGKDACGYGVLHKACSQGHVCMVKVLLAAGAKVDEEDQAKRTAIHGASSNGHAEVVRVLLDAGAPIEAKSITKLTPLHEAVRKERMDVTEVLLAANACLEAREARRWTPLLLATKVANVSMVEMLIKAHADVNAKDIFGATPLHNACHDNSGAMARVLLRSKAQIDATKKSGTTALYEATCAGHVKVVRVLLEAGAHVDTAVLKGSGFTALHVAASSDSDVILKALLEAWLCECQENSVLPWLTPPLSASTTHYNAS